MNKGRIVWVEDKAPIIYALVEPLEASGYEIQTIRTLEQAVEDIEDIISATAVILDIQLPNLRDEPLAGLALMRLLREREIRSPVIVLTVEGGRDLREQLAELGVASILRKEILPEELYDAVTNSLTLPKPDDERGYS